MKTITIIGARPQFIKAASISRAFRQHRRDVAEILLHTGQHYDRNMSDIFFNELEIPAPKYNLGVGGGSHGQNTGRMIEKIEQILMDEKPNLLLVYGDTDSTLAGAITASKLHIPVAHVEAGLRSFNRKMPEEINRIVTDHISSLLFTPTQLASDNLSKEGVERKKIHLIGDVMYDAALYFGKKADKESAVLENTSVKPKEYILATIHRAENTDDPNRLRRVLNSLAQAPLPVVWPIHPRTRHRIEEFDLLLPKNVIAIDPVGYLDMVMLERHSKLIATDSGGVQKEAFFHRVPCLTLRTETEWVELVEKGVNRLVMCPNSDDFTFAPDGRIFDEKIYGDGSAAKKVVDLIA